MVLQQQPAKSCVYGTLGEGGTGASVKISGMSEAGNVVQYDVVAKVTDGGSWKACLQPEKAGGLHTITATCTGCINKTAAVIAGATFGDVWYCGGRSFYPTAPHIASSGSHCHVLAMFLAWHLIRASATTSLHGVRASASPVGLALFVDCRTLVDHSTPSLGLEYTCTGQSNMALPLVHSYTRNITRDAILAGKYANIRIHGMKGNMNPFQPVVTLKPFLQLLGEGHPFRTTFSQFWPHQLRLQMSKNPAELIERLDVLGKKP
jgi:hypothetical protein